jgi:hypothetical protein
MSSVPRLTMDLKRLCNMDLNRVFLKRLSDSIFLKLLLVIETNGETTKFLIENYVFFRKKQKYPNVAFF